MNDEAKTYELQGAAVDTAAALVVVPRDVRASILAAITEDRIVGIEIKGKGPHHTFEDHRTVRRVGKALAGRTLDGDLHDGVPY